MRREQAIGEMLWRLFKSSFPILASSESEYQTNNKTGQSHVTFWNIQRTDYSAGLASFLKAYVYDSSIRKCVR